MEQLIKNIEQWFIDRGLDKADPNKQLLKFIEEAGELASGLARDDKDLIADSIGDMAVVLIGLTKQLNINLKYEELEDEVVLIHPISWKLTGLMSSVTGTVKLRGIMGDAHRELDINHAFQDLEIIYNNVLKDVSFKDCLQLAYNEIKDRKGKLINGVFIKEEDLK